MRFSRRENLSRPLVILKLPFFRRFNDKCWRFLSELRLTVNYVNPSCLILLTSKFRVRLSRPFSHYNPVDRLWIPASSILFSVNYKVKVLICLSYLSYLEKTCNSLLRKLFSHKPMCNDLKFESVEILANN